MIYELKYFKSDLGSFDCLAWEYGDFIQRKYINTKNIYYIETFEDCDEWNNECWGLKINNEKIQLARLSIFEDETRDETEGREYDVISKYFMLRRTGREDIFFENLEEEERKIYDDFHQKLGVKVRCAIEYINSELDKIVKFMGQDR